MLANKFIDALFFDSRGSVIRMEDVLEGGLHGERWGKLRRPA